MQLHQLAERTFPHGDIAVISLVLPHADSMNMPSRGIASWPHRTSLKRTSMHFQRAATAVLLFTLSAGAHAGPPTAYPSFDGQGTSLMLVVGNIGEATFLPRPKSPSCLPPQVCIALNPPPFWFAVDVIATVYGEDAPATFDAATISHYGLSDFNSANPYLAMFETNGREFRMLRYAKAPLARKKNGELHLVVRFDRHIAWLPCSVTGLREEIIADDFAETLEITGEDLAYYKVKEQATVYRTTASGALPRFSISVAHLQAHLRELAPTADTMACRQ